MDEKKRIIEFDAAESVPVDGQMAIDSPQLGTKKITPTLLLKDINDLLGDVPLQTQAQILTGAINELNAKIFQASIKTQAEWEALPDTKFSDNIAYYIRDGESTVGNALWTKVGLHGLDTNAKNCSDAINELKGTLDELITYIEISGTTSSSGALLLPNVVQAGIIVEMVYKTISGFIFRRDAGYLTCCDNNRNTLSNTDVVIRCWYISASHLHYN